MLLLLLKCGGRGTFEGVKFEAMIYIFVNELTSFPARLASSAADP